MVQRIAALLLILCGAARAASPHLDNILPPGIQRGADTDVVITGSRLSDARGLLIYAPGIQVLSMQPVNDGKVLARLRAAPDCPLGEHEVRLWTASGLSEMLPLYAGPFPEIACSATNHIITHAQPVPMNSTVTGIIHDEEVDYFSIQARKGDRLTAEVEGMRLGRDMFDPCAAILDTNGKQIAANDDNPLFLQDPLVSTIAPADGRYLVSVRETTWGGSARSYYRLHIGNYPQPVTVYPSGGPAGQTIPAYFLGDPKGVIASTLQLPAVTSIPFAAQVTEGGIPAPAPLPMRVCPFPNILKQEPNHTILHATPANVPPPVAFNGILLKPKDRDFFRFHASRGQSLDITVYARQLRSPIDSVIDLWDSKGIHIDNNDDSIGLDSYLQFNVPADGDYYVSIRDQLHRGGPTFVYRIEVVPVVPKLTFTEPIYTKDSQERQTVVIPRGNRYGTTLRLTNSGFDGDFLLRLPAMPPGVTVRPGPHSAGLLPVVFEAAPDAPIAAALTDVQAQPVDPSKHVEGGYDQNVELTYGPPNDYAYLTTEVHQLAIAVAQEAPFRVDLVPPPVPLLQDGQATLKVTALRSPGFTGPINVSLLYNPPGVSSQPVTIPSGQSSADLPINATGDAKTKTWQIAVTASADAGHGTVWVSSDLVPLTVAKPFISAHLDRANAIQGQPVTVTCEFDQSLPFDGKASIKLLGLPVKVTAPDVQVSSTDKQAVFNVTTDPASPAGQHRDLFCQVTVQKSGVRMVANTAFGGVLRIDKATPKKDLADQ